jgi:hypothetical protein
MGQSFSSQTDIADKFWLPEEAQHGHKENFAEDTRHRERVQPLRNRGTHYLIYHFNLGIMPRMTCENRIK